MNWESYACRFVLGVLLTVCLACVGVVRPSFVDGNSLYVSNGTHIIRIDRTSHIRKIIYVESEGRIIGLAADIEDNLLFWSDIGQRKAIFKSRLDGTGVQIIVTDVEECNGMSVDWISNHIYWTDAGKKTIELANYDGKGRRILIGYGLEKPRGIIVDPVFKNVFWADQGTKRIEKSWLDGSNRRVLVDKHLHWPNQLAISYSTRKLYWVDQHKQNIMSCDLEGQDVNTEQHLSERISSDPVFGLVVIGNTAIFSTWFSATVQSTLVATRIPFWKEETTLRGSRELFSLVATAPSMQPPSFHPCGQEDRGGCSHLCLPTRGTSFRCACPTFGGLALSFNAKSCEVPSELLFFTLRDSGDIGFISLTGAQSPDLTLAGRSTSPSAVTYDPIEQIVYWSDVEENNIYRANLDGSEKEIFLNCSHGIGIVDGLAIDWVARRLYFTNMGQSAPGLDGAVYSWHRIEVISLDGHTRKTVVTDVERPRGLDLDIRNGFLFYGDWGKRPKIVQTLLDGSDETVILNSGLSNPNGLTFYNGRLYVADSNFNNLTSSPHLMVYDVANASWEQLKLSANVSLPMGLAVRGDTLYYTDWVSISGPKQGYLKSYDLRFGVDNSVILSGQRPTGLYYTPLARRQEPLDASCDSAICSNECVRIPSSPASAFACQCPDQSAKILSSNKATCERPENFLLFADLNTLKLLSLDSESEEGTHTLLYSDIKSNFVATTYDEQTDTIYWTDLSKKAIFSSPFNDISPAVVIATDHFIDGLTVDTDRQRLFWTGYLNNGSGIIARMNLQRGRSSYKEILTGLRKPRAILLWSKKKWLFWTEYGSKDSPPSVRRCRSNGKHQKVIMSSRLFWPNALTSQADVLYVGDGSGKVFSMNYDGSDKKELTFLANSVFHIYGMVVFHNVLFYSDWYTHSIYMVDMVTGEQEAVASHLSRPTSVVIYHPADLSVHSQCKEGRQKCNDTCIPVPRSYHCTCPIGSRLASDGTSCIQMLSPWDKTEDMRCSHSCGKHAVCAQLIPTLRYQCVCKAGFHGDGNECRGCHKDFFKPLLGNDTCQPCLPDMTTKGVTMATECVCEDSNLYPVNGVCTETTTKMETTTVLKTTTTQMSKSVNYFNQSGNTVLLGSKVTVFDDVMTTVVDYTEESDAVTTEATSSVPFLIPIEGNGDTDQAVGKPFFDGCPHGDVMVMSLSPQTNEVRLPVSAWVARDSYGNQLPITSNYPIIDDHVTLEWVANGQDGQQTVVFQAEDNWRQKTTCQFQVLIDDLVPPKFTYCPSDLVIKTPRHTERVLFPNPVAVDNVGVASLTGTHKSDSEFPQGSTVVRYTAIDKAGNMATCNFTITVIQEKQCNLPSIKNGAFVCGHDPTQVENCYIVCENEFVVSPIGVFGQAFNCLIVEDVVRLTALMTTQEPCLRKRKPTTVHQEFSLSFNGPCNPHDTHLIEALSTAVLEYLEARNLCKWAECRFSNMTIHCGPDVTKRRRYVEDKFAVKWNITIDNSTGFSRSQVEAILFNIKIELMKLAAALSIVVTKQHYTTVPGTVMTSPLAWVCHHGEMVYDDGCVACPAGSYLNVTLDRCVLCSRGYFQEHQMQTECEICAEGFTKEEGAITAKKCVTFPAIDEMSKFLIITACTFGFVFLCMVIFMYTQYRRQQKQAQKSLMLSNSTRYMTPNVYVAPPPMPKSKNMFDEPRDYIGSHDYEDIDGTINKANLDGFYRIPRVHRDSLNSFKTASDIIYRIPPSPSPRESTCTNSFKTSDDTLIPNSPIESSKSLKLSNEGFYNYKPPMSPRTASSSTTNNSFRSSPDSTPYRSPQSVTRGDAHASSNNNNMHRFRSPPESPYRSPRMQRAFPNTFHTPDDVSSSPVFRSPADEGQPFHQQRGDTPLSLKLLRDAQYRSPVLPRDAQNSFKPLGDSLYRRPPSPISPCSSGRVSSESLHRAPSTPPRTSPNASRARLELMFRTPPASRSKKITENSCYEYE